MKNFAPGSDLTTESANSAEDASGRKYPSIFTSASQKVKGWARHHRGEIAWAAVFAITVAWLLDPPKPHPYTLYFVVDHRSDPDTRTMFKSIEEDSRTDSLTLGDVPIQVVVEELEDGLASTAIAKASDLSSRPDTLLVIAHLPSSLIEESILSYFHANPQVPVLTTTASDEDLLIKCRPPGAACFQDGWFAPLLQLSPTNKEQGRSAIRFATQNQKRRFLIVSQNDSNQDPYSKDLIQAYHDAIDEFNDENSRAGDGAGIVGKYKLESLPDKTLLSKARPDCVLYAGELDTAHGLLNLFPEPQPMVILSDSTLESRLSDNALKEFTPMRFTYQTDAGDYNDHTNVYGRDAYSIAKQLINDLNKRGGDWRFSLKTLLHFHSVKDARRSLVKIMEQNSIGRTWYRGYPHEHDPGTAYMFSREKRVNGMFHVWQLRKDSSLPGSAMDDIDNWHPPRMPSGHPVSVLAKPNP